MYDKFVTAIQPFAFTIVILAGATLAGWINVTNGKLVGYAAVFCGVMLVINHVVNQVKKG